MKPNNTKERIEELAAVARSIVAEFGIERLDAMSAAAAKSQMAAFAHQMQERTGCHRHTARAHIAQACRRLRHPDYQGA